MTTPIVHSAPFAFASTQELIDFVEGRSARRQPEYSRLGNPTVTCVERRLAALEGAESAQLFASGMAAITTLLLSVLKAGDHVILTSDCYNRTRSIVEKFLPRFGIASSVVTPDVDAIARAVTPATRLAITEVPSNPRLWIVDVEKLAALGRARGFLTVVDSTFATLVNFRPLEFGADAVVHSATKYLGGHNDLLAGVVAGKREFVAPVTETLHNLGGICDPATAFLLDRGLKTLALRVARHNENGMRVAEHLERQPGVAGVIYPGLPSHPHHAIARRLMSGFGGVVSFHVGTTFEDAARFVDRLTIPKIAPSLGGVESLVEQVVIMGYWEMDRAERERLGLRDNLVRLSLGIEDPEDIIRDIDQALERA